MKYQLYMYMYKQKIGEAYDCIKFKKKNIVGQSWSVLLSDSVSVSGSRSNLANCCL